MAKHDKTAIKDSKKELRKILQQKMAAALADHKNGMDEKDFQKSLKKASKIISKDMRQAAVVKLKKQKKAGKKPTKEQKEYLM